MMSAKQPPVTLQVIDAEAVKTLAAMVSWEFFERRTRRKQSVPRLSIVAQVHTGALHLVQSASVLTPGIIEHGSFSVVGWVTHNPKEDVYRLHGALLEGIAPDLVAAFEAQGRKAVFVKPGEGDR